VALGSSDAAKVGDAVVAVGNPFGLGQSVSRGIVSALSRGGFGIETYEDFIQTDAAINPGNSGGALFDTDGRVVGINTAIVSESGGNQGIGFAVPVNMARHVMERLISGGKVARGLMGVFPQDITPALAEAFNLPNSNGALVGNVTPNFPAEKAGIKSGDVITSFNGKKVADAHDLILMVSDCEPGTKATVDLIQGGRPKTVSVVLVENERAASSSNNGNNSSSVAASSKPDALDGVTVQDVDADTRGSLGIPTAVKGALVSAVTADSNSANAGLQRGDVIVEINRLAVTNSASAIKLCTDAKTKQILLKVWRGGGGPGNTLWLGVDNAKKS